MSQWSVYTTNGSQHSRHTLGSKYNSDIRLLSLSIIAFVFLFQEWLDDIGLPQYKEYFVEAKVDGRLLNNLTLVRTRFQRRMVISIVL